MDCFLLLIMMLYNGNSSVACSSSSNCQFDKVKDSSGIHEARFLYHGKYMNAGKGKGRKKGMVPEPSSLMVSTEAILN